MRGRRLAPNVRMILRDLAAHMKALEDEALIKRIEYGEVFVFEDRPD